MHTPKVNKVTQGGRVSNVDIKNGKQPNEYFGTVTIAIDDGYFKKEANSQQQSWVERVYFIDFKFDNRALGQFKTPVSVGDEVIISGKLIQDKWVEESTQAKRSAIKVKALNVDSHRTKAEIECLKSAGFGRQNAPQQQSAPQQQGGYAPQQQSAPQQQGGYAPQQQ
ncbi:MAG: single-stranded DNA-binding protein, partial [Pseudoalteromonas prydzensis]